MGINLAYTDKTPPIWVGSTLGWTRFLEWAGALPTEEYPDLVEFAANGRNNGAIYVSDQIEHALDAVPPTYQGVVDICRILIDDALMGFEDETVFIAADESADVSEIYGDDPSLPPPDEVGESDDENYDPNAKADDDDFEVKDDDVKKKATDSASSQHAASVRMLEEAAALCGLTAEFEAGSLTFEQRRKIILAVAEMAEKRLRKEAERLLGEIESDGKTKALNDFPDDGPLPSHSVRTRAVLDKIQGFFRRAKKLLRTAYLAGTLALAGTTDPLAGTMAKAHQVQTDKQFEYFTKFQTEVENGTQPIDGTFVARAEMYGASTWGVAQNTILDTAPSYGMQLGRRVHGPSDVPCVDCRAAVASGWIPIDEIPPIGQSVCRSRCHCHIEYEDSLGDEYQVFPPKPLPGPKKPKPAPPAAVTLPRPSQAAIELSKQDPAAKIEKAAKKLLGKPVTVRDIAGIVGAPADTTVRIFTNPDGSLWVNAESSGVEMRRFLRVDLDGNPYIKNEFFSIKSVTDQNKGMGLAIFADQVENAAALGITEIRTEAARGPTFNGYYTWARFGYDGAIPGGLAPLPDALKSAKRISEVMGSQEGRDWWRANGVTFNGEFDLTEGSYSRRTLDAYRAERAKGKT